MPVVICLLRGVNVGGHNRMKMDLFRELLETLGMQNVQTYVQSGNAVFQSKSDKLGPLAREIEDAIESTCGFRPGVVLRTTAELRATIKKNPFSKRPNMEPSKLLVTFLNACPDAICRGNALAIKIFPEELHVVGSEAFAYFPNGMGRPVMQWPRIEKALKTWGTGRNWNTVAKLLEMAETLEAV